MTTHLSTGRERRYLPRIYTDWDGYAIPDRRTTDRRVDEDMRAVAQDLIDGHTHCAADCGANRIVLAIRRTLDPILVEAEP